jgi:RNA polymerase sigma-70 factor, ECF subfamily
VDFDRLAARHRDAVYRQMVRVCGDYDDAEDALAEALLAAFRHSGKLRDETSFRAWLATIGRRVCGRIQSRSDLRQALELPPDLEGSPTPQEELEMAQVKTCVRSAIERLPKSLREVYQMREIEQRPAEDVAQLLGLTVANVKTRLHRAREKVRLYLDAALCA